jgi:hypothetical protein
MLGAMMVLELRQYTLFGGRRDELIALFEREFVAPQNAVGAQVVGTFRDLDDPDRFVWLRSFHDMAARAQALDAFYGGPVWQAHRSAANATMVDSGNVLLLRPFTQPQPAHTASRPLPHGDSLIRLSVHYLRETDALRFAQFFEAHYAPRVESRGVPILGRFISETAANNFPRLPVRERESVFVWMARLETEAAEQRLSAALAADSGWRDAAAEEILPALRAKPEILRLWPTATSALR